MNKTALYIKNRLSLRVPQIDSLAILAELCDKLELTKGVDLGAELAKVHEAFPTCVDFERDFPSLCFALATGVGKTRLMGAFITYLYLEKGIKNFFVLAPNLTIYNKLIADFSNPSNPKYVFTGVGELVTNQPQVITGDNYLNRRIFDTRTSGTLGDEPICINVFNISKINAETRGGNAPKMKRLSEYIGDSYFNYLVNLPDLILLMDESHHYRADRGMQVLNELNPILGLELTATPQVERSNTAIKFKNVVYEYSLGKAIADGYVKEPAVATRKDFDPSNYSLEELDQLKLADGIRIHEDTKVALDEYARNEGCHLVKPFVLVVAKDTDHSAQLRQFMTSKDFFEGLYADKIIEVNSNQSGTEKDENVAKLLALEEPDNTIEIVIHVNMLKEGWDVTNLYTIIPLRTAASLTLREQTIGRGLRLPYGKRTGNPRVDKLTIVAHDKFQAIIEEANKPDSIINRQNIIVIDPEEYQGTKEVVTVQSLVEQRLLTKKEALEGASNLTPAEKAKETTTIQAKECIYKALPRISQVSSSDFKKPEIKELVIEKIKESLENQPQLGLFNDQFLHEIQAVYETTVDEIKQNIIEIPRIVIQPAGEVNSGFKGFDLVIQGINYQPVSEEILMRFLDRKENNLYSLGVKGGVAFDTPVNIIVNELINLPEVDYDQNSNLLFKLAGQMVKHFQSYLNEKDLDNVVKYHKRDIAAYIYAQMKEHFYYTVSAYEKPKVYPFSRIEPHNLTKITKDGIRHYTDTIEPANTIPQKVFTGFTKSCHEFYKFDRKNEKDFATILEQDTVVLKWLRPAPNQFNIYWDRNAHRYEPDFVAETQDTIYLIEIKKVSDMDDREVQEKAKAALEYCKNATDYDLENGDKSWKYVLIPHDEVNFNMGFETLMKRFMYGE
ncbi:MAG TPA: type III restriction endonuclease subunit R [Firmicutes bacterium]|nr:type III restriction endonuclease subunit R [Bacillota bacterium]